MLLQGKDAGLGVAGAIAMTLLIACGGSGDPPATGTSPGPLTEGELTEVEPRSIGIGDELVVSGTSWTTGIAVNYYLFAEDKYHDVTFLEIDEEGFSAGSSYPDQDGLISFRFDLKSAYTAQSGSLLEPTPGDRFLLVAVQRTASQGEASFIGPITVVPREDS